MPYIVKSTGGNFKLRDLGTGKSLPVDAIGTVFDTPARLVDPQLEIKEVSDAEAEKFAGERARKEKKFADAVAKATAEDAARDAARAEAARAAAKPKAAK